MYSRVPVGHTAAVDEGDMYTLDGGRFLKVGVAFHPHLSAVAGHEEMWHNVEVRGVVTRVGQFCQGILMVGMEVTTERWEALSVGEGFSTSAAGTRPVLHSPPVKVSVLPPDTSISSAN